MQASASRLLQHGNVMKQGNQAQRKQKSELWKMAPYHNFNEPAHARHAFGVWPFTSRRLLSGNSTGNRIKTSAVKVWKKLAKKGQKTICLSLAYDVFGTITGGSAYTALV